MKALLNYFVDLCLLRAGPQDLASSPPLLILTTLANIAVGVVMIADARGGGFSALAESGFEAGLMLAALYLGLQVRKLLPRFTQTATALMGSGLLLGLLALPLVSWSQRSESSEAGLLLMLLIIWSMVVMGHILRHSFEIRFNLGLGVAVLYTLLAWKLTYLFFPAVA